jgi:hypothetical protein
MVVLINHRLIITKHVDWSIQSKTHHPNSVSKFHRNIRGNSCRNQFRSVSVAMEIRARVLVAYITSKRSSIATQLRDPMTPRLGHLEATKSVLGYLKKHPNYRILLNPSKIDMSEAVEKYPELEGILSLGERTDPRWDSRTDEEQKGYYGGRRSRTLRSDQAIGDGNSCFYQFYPSSMVFEDAEDSRDIYLRIGIGCGKNCHGYCDGI